MKTMKLFLCTHSLTRFGVFSNGLCFVFRSLKSKQKIKEYHTVLTIEFTWKKQSNLREKKPCYSLPILMQYPNTHNLPVQIFQFRWKVAFVVTWQRFDLIHFQMPRKVISFKLYFRGFLFICIRQIQIQSTLP